MVCVWIETKQKKSKHRPARSISIYPISVYIIQLERLYYYYYLRASGYYIRSRVLLSSCPGGEITTVRKNSKMCRTTGENEKQKKSIEHVHLHHCWVLYYIFWCRCHGRCAIMIDRSFPPPSRSLSHLYGVHYPILYNSGAKGKKKNPAII